MYVRGSVYTWVYVEKGMAVCCSLPLAFLLVFFWSLCLESVAFRDGARSWDDLSIWMIFLSCG